MARNIIIEKLSFGIKDQEVEIVERKGIGHPDTICDAICESASRELSKYYLKEFGEIMHHNVDKALLIAGRSEKKFGSGRIIKPIKLIISGRATSKVKEREIPVEEISLMSARKYIKDNLRMLRDDFIEISTQTEQGSSDLCTNFSRGREIPLANDTSFGVGFAPLSEIEHLVLKVSDFINSKEIRDKYPFVGEDTKVMGIRRGKDINLFVAIAFIDKYISNLKDYIDKKKIVENEIMDFAKKFNEDIKCSVNSSDTCKSIEDIYLTVSGTSAENGDDGQVGRGNRITGLITPCRPMTLEAASGKNPRTHTGKVYSVLAQLIANDIYDKLKVREVHVKILSQIGKPIDQPAVCSIQILDNLNEQLNKEAYKIANDWFSNIPKVTDMIVNEQVRLY